MARYVPARSQGGAGALGGVLPPEPTGPQPPDWRTLPVDRGATAMALDDLYRDWHTRLRKVLVGKLRCESRVVEDALSFAYDKLLERGIPECVNPGFVQMAAYRRALGELQGKYGRVLSLEEDVSRPGSDTPERRGDLIPARDGQPHQRAEAVELLERLAELRPGQRQALTDQIAGYSMTESARRRGRTLTWVNRHRTEGRQALRSALAA